MDRWEGTLSLLSLPFPDVQSRDNDERRYEWIGKKGMREEIQGFYR